MVGNLGGGEGVKAPGGEGVRGKGKEVPQTQRAMQTQLHPSHHTIFGIFLLFFLFCVCIFLSFLEMEIVGSSLHTAVKPFNFLESFIFFLMRCSAKLF